MHTRQDCYELNFHPLEIVGRGTVVGENYTLFVKFENRDIWTRERSNITICKFNKFIPNTSDLID